MTTSLVSETLSGSPIGLSHIADGMDSVRAPWGVTADFYRGEAREVLAGLPTGLVQTIVTSPPYFHGRLYPAADAVYGGDPRSCPTPAYHTWHTAKTYYPAGPAGTKAADAFTTAGPDNAARVRRGRWVESQRCLRCRAWKGQLGLEATPDDYVAHLCDVFDAAYRVLRPDGTLFLNLGDSHAGAGYANHTGTGGARRADGGRQQHNIIPNVRTKSLVGMPWRVAAALADRGWLLRSAIIWVKPDGMYEPGARDRPVNSYEHIFLFAKDGRYYYDPEANPAPRAENPDATKFGPNIWTVPVQSSRSSHNATMPELLAQKCLRAGSRPGDWVLDPFGGTGTTALVALQNGRSAVSIELGDGYHREAVQAAVERTGAPREPLHQPRRADGVRHICAGCGLSYRHHPLAYEFPSSIDGEPYLTRLCDGTLVHL